MQFCQKWPKTSKRQKPPKPKKGGQEIRSLGTILGSPDPGFQVLANHFLQMHSFCVNVNVELAEPGFLVQKVPGLYRGWVSLEGSWTRKTVLALFSRRRMENSAKTAFLVQELSRDTHPRSNPGAFWARNPGSRRLVVRLRMVWSKYCTTHR